MTGMKYLVVEMGGAEEVVMGPPWRTHKEMQGYLHVSLNSIVSAGFVSMNDRGELRCAGRSGGLNKDSRPEEDLELIIRQLKFSS